LIDNLQIILYYGNGIKMKITKPARLVKVELEKTRKSYYKIYVEQISSIYKGESKYIYEKYIILDNI